MTKEEALQLVNKTTYKKCSRTGRKFLHSGPGYGGSCFPKDTRALVQMGKEFGSPQKIVESVVVSNEETKIRMISKITALLDNKINEKVICFLGVTFKPNTDDLREAPSLTIIPELIRLGATIRIVDPQGFKEGKEILQSA